MYMFLSFERTLCILYLQGWLCWSKIRQISPELTERPIFKSRPFLDSFFPACQTFYLFSLPHCIHICPLVYNQNVQPSFKSVDGKYYDLLWLIWQKLFSSDDRILHASLHSGWRTYSLGDIIWQVFAIFIISTFVFMAIMISLRFMAVICPLRTRVTQRKARQRLF